MFRKSVHGGLLALLLLPTWASVSAIEVPLPRLELVPFTATQPDAPSKTVPQTEEAIREKEAPRRLPFLYDVMPEDDDREDHPAQRDMLDIRGA